MLALIWEFAQERDTLDICETHWTVQKFLLYQAFRLYCSALIESGMYFKIEYAYEQVKSNVEKKLHVYTAKFEYACF